MRKSIVVFFLFLVQFLSTKAQENLVLNPGFEDMNWCWYSSKYQVYYETMGYFICNKYPYYTNTKNYEPNISEFTNKTWTNPSDSSLLWFNILSKPNNYSPKRGFYGSYFWFLHYTGGALVVNAIKPMLQSSNYGLATACIRLLVEVDHPYNIYRDDNRSFLQGRLSKPLKKGCQYVFKSYVYRYDDNSSYMPYATSSFGVAFVQDSVQYSSYKELIAKHLPDIENPTNRWLNDTADFMLVDGIYTAKGGERYLLLGNFKTNAETPYTPAHVKIPDINNPGNYLRTDINYYIDNVSLTAIPPSHLKLNLGKDTLTCGNDQPLQLAAQLGFDSYNWNTGDTSRVLNITKAGTYIVKADFGCGVLSDTIVVKAFQYKKNQLQIGELLQKCPEEQISLKAANGYSNYTWSNGQTGAELSTSIEGIYTLQANCEEGCIIKDTVQILNITAPQKVNLAKDTVICQGKSIVLDAGTQNAVNFAWSTGSTSQTIEAKVAGNYSVAVSNKCFQVSDTINISTIDCSPIFIPNVFTPNGDGNNDTFKIRTEDNRTVTLDIYNRWGERLYHQASYHNQWNAEGIPDGIYFYQIVDSEYSKTEKGWVQVIR